jgi:hypothetical protein
LLVRALRGSGGGATILDVDGVIGFLGSYLDTIAFGIAGEGRVAREVGRIFRGEVLGVGLHDPAVLVDYVEESVPLGLAGVVGLEDDPEALAADLERITLLVATSRDLGHWRTPALLLGEGRRAEVYR